MMKVLITLIAAAMLSGCVGRVQVAATPESPVPSSKVEVTCQADGTTELGTSSVSAEPAGVRVVVRNYLDERASVSGLGLDVPTGRTERMALVPPGYVRVACRPLGDQDSLQGLASRPLQVLDPRSFYNDPELGCGDGMFRSSLVDFMAPGPDESSSIPLGEGSRRIWGLLPDDDVVMGAYPEQPAAPVLVVRHGAVVGSFGFGLIGDRWVSTGYSVCDEEGLHASTWLGSRGIVAIG